MDTDKLTTASGERVQVIYPGRENRDSGPDFLGATIVGADGKLLNGDVELHLKSSDWRSHGHHRDPRYNGVILQVVWDGEKAAVLQNGKIAPTLSLCRYLKGSLDEVREWACLSILPDEPCHNAGQRLGAGEIGRLLDKAGEERFRLKTGCFATRLGNEPPAQVLYQGIMGALGYTKNKEQFEELSCRLPLAVLESFCSGKHPQEQVLVLKALLLGEAGLLPKCGDNELEQLWRCLGKEETMSPTYWHLFRVRPENQPARRLIGAAHLLARFIKGGLLQGVLRLVNDYSTDVEQLESSFMVGAPDSCYDSERALIGCGRAREIVVNIVLPFTFAWAEANSRAELAERALSLYRIYPGAGENEITRRLTKLLGIGVSVLVNSARRQQGLIHLDKTFCCYRRCDDCPLARKLALVSVQPSAISV